MEKPADLPNPKSYLISKHLGGGSFGDVYEGVGPNHEKVAIKYEKHGSKCPQLRHEYKVYRELKHCFGFCRALYFGVIDNYNVLVLDLVGPSLEDLFQQCGRKFSLKTVLLLADQLLDRVATMHERHLIHRDIKPHNFAIGLNDNYKVVYCIDFGLSKRYRNPKTPHLDHNPYRDGRSLIGTPRYASINNHVGIEYSRRDDLESIGYMLIYFLKGTLPWQGLKATTKNDKYKLIKEKKLSMPVEQLCLGIPTEFATFITYSRRLSFTSAPDIPYLRKLFHDLYIAQCDTSNTTWDWDKKAGGGRTRSTPGGRSLPSENNSMQALADEEPPLVPGAAPRVEEQLPTVFKQLNVETEETNDFDDP